jgi:hypothetical protein
MQFLLSNAAVGHFLLTGKRHDFRVSYKQAKGTTAVTGEQILLYTSAFAMLSILSIVQLSSSPEQKKSNRDVTPKIIEKKPKSETDDDVPHKHPKNKQTNNTSKTTDSKKKK